MEQDHTLSDLLTAIVMENSLDEEITDINAIVLQIVRYNLVSICKAALFVTDDLKNPEHFNLPGLIEGLVEIINWITKYADLDESTE